jgi:tetraacyldisaccharide 4''-kinase
LYCFYLIFRFGIIVGNFISIKKLCKILIICIGNIVVGGAGKTPVSLKVGKLLIKSGYKPHFISKGYSGLIKESTLVESWHSPSSVGDESILLSEIAPTWIGNDRVKSSYLAMQNGADCLIMDDGFQNPSIEKNFSIIVINSEQEFGNKRVMPSGPLRESIKRGLDRTNLVIVIGEIQMI